MNPTEMAIIQAFWDILENKPYNKVTVNDVAQQCKINRNTFYYHFDDMNDLLERVMKHEADILIKNYREVNSIADCLIPFLSNALKRRQAFLHIYQSIKRDVFLEQLDRIALYTTTQYIETQTQDFLITAYDKKVLIRFYKCAIVGIVLDWLDHNMEDDLASALVRISDLFAGSSQKAFIKSAKPVPE